MLDLGAHLANGHAPDNAESDNGGIAAARLLAIKADIRASLNSNLSADILARRHAISTRYIHRLFERGGTTMSRYILGLRLEALRRMLVDGRNRGRTVTELIYASGFKDISTCNRAFKERYGISPGAARHSNC